MEELNRDTPITHTGSIQIWQWDKRVTFIPAVMLVHPGKCQRRQQQEKDFGFKGRAYVYTTLQQSQTVKAGF